MPSFHHSSPGLARESLSNPNPNILLAAVVLDPACCCCRCCLSIARLDNLVFDPERDDHIKAVLDWELSTLGDPLADLAYSCMPYHLPAGGYAPACQGGSVCESAKGRRCQHRAAGL